MGPPAFAEGKEKEEASLWLSQRTGSWGAMGVPTPPQVPCTRVAGSNHRRRAFLRGDGIFVKLSGSKIELDRNSGSVSPRRRLFRVD